MRHDSPELDFVVLEYITITKDSRTGLIVALGGTEQAAGILQSTGGFLNVAGPRGEYHRLPSGLPDEQRHVRATAAAHALLAAGYSVHLDPALNVLSSPGGDHQTAQRYLARLADRAGNGDETAEILTEIAAPAQGLLPLVREVVVRAALACSEHPSSAGHDVEPAHRLLNAADSLDVTTRVIAQARNDTARTPHRSRRQPLLSSPPKSAGSAASRIR